MLVRLEELTDPDLHPEDFTCRKCSVWFYGILCRDETRRKRSAKKSIAVLKRLRSDLRTAQSIRLRWNLGGSVTVTSPS